MANVSFRIIWSSVPHRGCRLRKRRYGRFGGRCRMSSLRAIGIRALPWGSIGICSGWCPEWRSTTNAAWRRRGRPCSRTWWSLVRARRKVLPDCDTSVRPSVRAWARPRRPFQASWAARTEASACPKRRVRLLPVSLPADGEHGRFRRLLSCHRWALCAGRRGRHASWCWDCTWCVCRDGRSRCR